MATKFLLLAGLLLGSATAGSHKDGPSPPELRGSQPPLEPRGDIPAKAMENDHPSRDNDLSAEESRRVVASGKMAKASATTLACSRSSSVHMMGDRDVVTFKSPRHPRTYRPRTSCGWALQATSPDAYFVVSCSYFRLQNMRRRYCADYLRLDRQKFCGGGRRGLRRWYSSGSYLRMWFRSNKNRNYRGFKCTATAYIRQPLTTAEPQSTCGATCGVPNRSTRIVGGAATEVNEYPWQVAIARKTGNDFQDFFCGGSIINRRWVLSAAHCEISASLHRVIAGAHRWNSNPVSYTSVDIANVIDHASYNSATFNNDIALVRVSQDFDFSLLGLAPVCLPVLGSTEAYTGQKATITGWGKLAYQTNLYPPELHEVEVDVVSNADCTRDYGAGRITGNMLCAGIDAGGKDSCQGDSGGPLTVGDSNVYTQVGVVSFGIGCASPDYYGVYARVTRYMYWIDSIVGDDGYCNQN
ncbi:chymotrypsin-like protease CTRL-1 [Macrobrachium rosenbergii]|uniref:chymotrypsin-like protease CTRL-1 n=1 Tax=Macrobrachium rosenbergii TaxID=79674 RepID=UPI0034D4B9D4